MLAFSFGDSLIKVFYIASKINNLISDRVTVVLLLCVFIAKIKEDAA